MGVVEEAPGTGFSKVPAARMKKIETRLPWETLGARPEMLQTASAPWAKLERPIRVVSALSKGDVRTHPVAAVVEGVKGPMDHCH